MSAEQAEIGSITTAAEGLGTRIEDDTVCCYARHDTVWVTGPGADPWEVDAVTAVSAVYGADGLTDACCVT